MGTSQMSISFAAGSQVNRENTVRHICALKMEENEKNDQHLRGLSGREAAISHILPSFGHCSKSKLRGSNPL